jgi:hypothetical protein
MIKHWEKQARILLKAAHDAAVAGDAQDALDLAIGATSILGSARHVERADEYLRKEAAALEAKP